MEESEKKKLLFEVAERALPKFQQSSEFLEELNALLKKYPLTTNVIANPVFASQN